MTTLDRKQKYGPKHKTVSDHTDAFKLATTFDIVSLDLLCSFVISENRLVKRSVLNSLSNLMDCMDMTVYSKDAEKMKRINFLRLGLQARLEKNINNRDIILKHIAGGLNEELTTSINLKELSSEEIDWIIGTIAGAMDFLAIDVYCDQLSESLERFRNAEYINKASIIDEVKEGVGRLNNEFRKIRTKTSDSEYFCLENEVFIDKISNTYNELKNPAHVLRSGMQGLNAMLHGGFESTRVYMFMGLPGEGKSLTLLNLAYQIVRCNKDYRPKDPTKRPCVVYLTMENMDRESISRLYNISVGNGNMVDKTVEEVIYDMQTMGQLALRTSQDMDLIIKYVPDYSVDTSFLYDFTEDLRDDGREVCCFIQDYVRKIRPLVHTGDPYTDLGSVVGEFKNYAIWADVPVISASQCNREAAKIIDQKRRTNGSDLVRQLGRDNVGDSVLIINNADAVIMLTPEIDKEYNKYLGLNLVKRRYTNTYVETPECIYLPFEKGNGIKLIMDYGGVPLYRQTMVEQSLNTMNVGINAPLPNSMGLKTSQYMSKNSILDLSNNTSKPMTRADDGLKNLFDQSQVYSSTNVNGRLVPFVPGKGSPDMYLRLA